MSAAQNRFKQARSLSGGCEDTTCRVGGQI